MGISAAQYCSNDKIGGGLEGFSYGVGTEAELRDGVKFRRLNRRISPRNCYALFRATITSATSSLTIPLA